MVFWVFLNEFYIALVQSQALTPRLFALKPGDKVFLGKRISGMFTLDEVPAGNNLLLIGTGPGLAPYMSMLRNELDCKPDQHTVVLLGARHSWNLGYRGLVEMAMGIKPTLKKTHVLLCGNPAMIEGMIASGAKDGFVEHSKKEPGQIHAEKYW